MRRKIILEDRNARKDICKALDMTPQAISLALGFKRNSKKSMVARKMALENGGYLMVESDNGLMMRSNINK